MHGYLAVGATVLGTDVFDISRRAGRSEYIWGTIICNAYAYILPALIGVVFGPIFEVETVPNLFETIRLDTWSELGVSAVCLSLITALATLHAMVATTTLTVRRLHDFGLSGLLFLLAAAILLSLNSFIDQSAQALLRVSSDAWKLHPADPIITMLLWVTLGFPRGSEKPNRWGDCPATWPLKRASGKLEN